MASKPIKQHILLETTKFGLQELRFHFRDRKTIDVGTIVLNLHYLDASLENQSFTIKLDDTKVITEIHIRLEGKTIKGVLVPMNKSVLQYRSYEDYFA